MRPSVFGDRDLHSAFARGSRGLDPWQEFSVVHRADGVQFCRTVDTGADGHSVIEVGKEDGPVLKGLLC